MRNSFYVAIFFIIITIFPTNAETPDSIRYVAEATASFSGGSNNPFWFVSNRQGLSSIKTTNGYLRIGAFHDINESERFSWSAGVDLAVAANFSSVFIVQQLYGELKYRSLDFLIGSKNMYSPLENPTLSSGSLYYSGNSRPIPQVRIGIFDYADMWGCKGWFAIKGHLAFGKFTDSDWIKHWVAPNTYYTLGTLYHSKSLWFRFGNKAKKPFVFELGMQMATEFGGTQYKGNEMLLKMPTGLKDWIKAIIPMKGGSETPGIDQRNVQGNMLGSWNFALSYNPNSDWNIRLYYEHYFEDHSMMTFDYMWKDGLFGVETKLPKNRFVSSAVYEFVYMKDQAGPIFWDHKPEVNEQVSGADNYYNNSFYNGWSHWGMGIGTPLAVSPIYNNPHVVSFLSNRFWSHHVGLCGSPFNDLDYRILATYTKSWGTYSNPFKEVKQSLNMMLELSYSPHRLKGWKGILGVGADFGSLFGRSAGVTLTISKTGNIFKW